MPNEVVDEEQGVEIVRGIIAECLARELADVRRDSRLIPDLGADSLDFVDLIFTLEKRFGVRIREDDLNMMSRPNLPAPDGSPLLEFIPADAVSRLLPWLPELRSLPDLERVRPMEVLPLISVEALWRLVQQKRQAASR